MTKTKRYFRCINIFNNSNNCSIFLTVYLIKKWFDKSLTNFEKYFVVNNENDYLEEKELKWNFHKIIFDFYKNTGWILEFISLNKDMYWKNIINLKLNLTEIFNDIWNNKSYFFLKILLEIDEMTIIFRYKKTRKLKIF